MHFGHMKLYIAQCILGIWRVEDCIDGNACDGSLIALYICTWITENFQAAFVHLDGWRQSHLKQFGECIFMSKST
jgi:hypothetical protein